MRVGADDELLLVSSPYYTALFGFVMYIHVL